jgi:hypothetical protein
VDRLWSFRALIAVALASVILGGLAGAALANVGDDEDDRRGPGRFHRMGPMGPPHGQWQWRNGPRDDQMPRWSPRRGGPDELAPSPPAPTPTS